MAWADSRALSALRDAAVASADAATLMAHILGAEETWLARIEARSPTLAVWPELSIEEMAFFSSSLQASYREVVQRASDDALAKPIRYTNSAGQTFDTPLDDILIHVALHGTYHRGQVAILLRRGGAVPSPTDYIAFARGVPAATQADARALAAR